MAGPRDDPGMPDPPYRSLTPRQRQILPMIGQGLTNKAIAHQLGISESTVKAQVTAIMRALGMTSRTQAFLHTPHPDE